MSGTDLPFLQLQLTHILSQLPQYSALDMSTSVHTPTPATPPEESMSVVSPVLTPEGIETQLNPLPDEEPSEVRDLAASTSNVVMLFLLIGKSAEAVHGYCPSLSPKLHPSFQVCI